MANRIPLVKSVIFLKVALGALERFPPEVYTLENEHFGTSKSPNWKGNSSEPNKDLPR